MTKKRDLATARSIPKSSAIWLLVIIFLPIAVISSRCAGKTETPGEDTKSGMVLRLGPTMVSDEMNLFSSAFKGNEIIPIKYARQTIAGGSNISISLNWEEVPEETKSFALVMIDVSARNWAHWMVINISAETRSIEEGASGSRMPAGSKELFNTFGTPGYGGPQPPKGTGVHQYVTTLYALSVDKLSLPESTSYSDFLKAIEGKILAKASLSGGFSR